MTSPLIPIFERVLEREAQQTRPEPGTDGSARDRIAGRADRPSGEQPTSEVK